MFKKALALGVTLVLLLAACTQADTRGREVALGQETSLGIGQRIAIAGEPLQITFKDVLEDSRCPQDVTCVWEGRVSAAVQVTNASSSADLTLTQPGLTDGPAAAMYQRYQLSFRVEPYPKAGESISKDAYRLLLTVRKVV
ncbi:MAG: hypothetical protein HY683_07015 [Chloroflexi bacterium]|nr:hypothetical protein [Chloroflexota bacterium]